jgi:hypothetical protein
MVAVAASPAAAGKRGSKPQKGPGGHIIATTDFVFGLGTLSSPPGVAPNAFSYNAWSGAMGQNPNGLIYFRELSSKNRQVVGRVLCLRVDGDRASMLYEFAPGTTGQPAHHAGGRVFVDGTKLSDIGQGASSDAQRNGRLTAAQLAAEVAAGCPDPNTPAAPLNPLRSGGIVVNDA